MMVIKEVQTKHNEIEGTKLAAVDLSVIIPGW